MYVPSRQETVEDLDKHLESLQEFPDSEQYPLFHLLPEVLQHYNTMILLPPDMRAFTTQLASPAECLRLSKAITIAAYQGAQSTLGMARVIVCTPPPELLQVLRVV